MKKSLNLSSVHLGDAMLSQESGQVMNILIVTSWRSGSSFLGELLNQFPGTFYYFEPLHYYSQKMIQEEFLETLFRCQFGDSNHGFLEHVKKNSFLLSDRNKRLWDSCKLFPELERLEACFSEDYLNRVCPRFPLRLIKTVRLRVQKTRKLLENLPNTKILVLVRDPRAVFRYYTCLLNMC